MKTDQLEQKREKKKKIDLKEFMTMREELERYKLKDGKPKKNKGPGTASKNDRMQLDSTPVKNKGK